LQLDFFPCHQHQLERVVVPVFLATEEKENEKGKKKKKKNEKNINKDKE
jgi:hypothetical protein